MQEFGWIHTALGLFGSINFLAGSLLFLPAFDRLKTYGVWLFIVGAAFMLLGAPGDLLVKVNQARAEHPHYRDSSSHTKEGGRRDHRQTA